MSTPLQGVECGGQHAEGGDPGSQDQPRQRGEPHSPHQRPGPDATGMTCSATRPVSHEVIWQYQPGPPPSRGEGGVYIPLCGRGSLDAVEDPTPPTRLSIYHHICLWRMKTSGRPEAVQTHMLHAGYHYFMQVLNQHATTVICF